MLPSSTVERPPSPSLLPRGLSPGAAVLGALLPIRAPAGEGALPGRAWLAEPGLVPPAAPSRKGVASSGARCVATEASPAEAGRTPSRTIASYSLRVICVYVPSMLGGPSTTLPMQVMTTPLLAEKISHTGGCQPKGLWKPSVNLWVCLPPGAEWALPPSPRFFLPLSWSKRGSPLRPLLLLCWLRTLEGSSPLSTSYSMPQALGNCSTSSSSTQIMFPLESNVQGPLSASSATFRNHIICLAASASARRCSSACCANFSTRFLAFPARNLSSHSLMGGTSSTMGKDRDCSLWPLGVRWAFSKDRRSFIEPAASLLLSLMPSP
mmetsp:Transcript_72488/g.207991  ORF Transcript_72488/g.207991 Transcript_72488/m.207991 type:complete len:323 (+) Transcript_72488:467-1435(+)